VKTNRIAISIVLSLLIMMGMVAPATETASSLSGSGLADRPNILFCIADDATFRHMSAYGCRWVQTPAFDYVAQNGLLFQNAYTPNAKCSPSRSCILTGRNSWQLEEAANHVPFFPSKFKTFVEVLGENGYQTGFTGKGWAPGNPGKANGETRQLTGKAYNEKKLKAPTTAISGTDYAANLEVFLNEKPEGKPFCFWYGGHEPHRAYEYGSGMKKGGKKLSDIDEVPSFWMDTEVVRNDLLDYAYEIEYFDQQLQKILDLLKKHGELENTLVVVTSDNGMPFPRAKGHSYEYSNHLPLAMMWGGGIFGAGRKVEDYVSFIDFAPTFLEIAGVKKEAMQPMQGRSLLDIFKGKALTKRDHVLIGKERNDVGRPNDQAYPSRGIIRDQVLYIRNYEPDRWPTGNPETGYLDTDGSPTKTEILYAGRLNREDPLWKLSFGRRAV
jgi:N-sulfoglucosamine sulfohydrolase